MVLLALPMALKMKRDYDISASTYRLVSVDGNKLPCTPRRRGAQLPEIVAGTINLFNDRTFRATITYGSGSGGSATTRTFKGTYSGTNAITSLLWEGAGETPVSLEENRLTLDNEGMRFVYERVTGHRHIGVPRVILPPGAARIQRWRGRRPPW